MISLIGHDVLEALRLMERDHLLTTPREMVCKICFITSPSTSIMYHLFHLRSTISEAAGLVYLAELS